MADMMTVRDLVHALMDYSLDKRVYIGKGQGPVGKVEEVQGYLVLSSVVRDA